MSSKQSAILEYILFALGICIVILNGLKLDIFEVDTNTILIYFILSFSLVVKYFGAPTKKEMNIEVKEEIKQAKELLDLSKNKINDLPPAGKKADIFETFRLEEIREKLKKDVAMTFALIKIDLDEKLKAANEFFGFVVNGRNPDLRTVKQLRAKKIINGEQADFLISVISLCDKVVNGASISKTEARQVVNLLQSFNASFKDGYSINFEPNKDFMDQNQVCEWAHCIKLMPFKKAREICFCPRLGHDCPGGKKKVSECNKSLVEIPNRAFVKFVQTSLFDEAKNSN